MRLRFGSPYLSITSFEEIELPSFCVITGVNGAGKSHLLQAITKSHVSVDQTPIEEIVLFSGETFRLDNQSPLTADAAVQERYNAWEFLNQQQNQNLIGNLKNYRNALSDSAENLSVLAKRLDKPIWRLGLGDGLSEMEYGRLNTYRSSIRNLLMNNPQLRGNQQAQSIFILCTKLRTYIDDISKTEFYSLYEPRNFKENFLPSQLTMAFADYFSRLDENDYYKYRNSLGESHVVLSEEEFVMRYGPKPWDVVNQVLSQIGTVPYRINSPEGLTRYDRFQAELIHQYNDKVRPQFSDLSSGEKILLALVVSVYKASSDRYFPKVLLLDEIDASLHPSMMRSMLQIIQDVFLRNGVAVILVTHSPTTVAICPEESIYVMHPSGEKRVEHRSRASALDILTEGFITLTKGLTVLDEVARTKVSVVTEGKNIEFVRRALEIADIDDVEIVSGVEDRSGSQQLKTLYDFFSRLPHDGKIIVAWDCDAAKYNSLAVENNTHPFVFEQNQSNSIATKGIENLFPESLLADFLKKITWSDGKEKCEFDENKKSEFADFILARRVDSDFDLFKPLLDLIRSLSDSEGRPAEEALEPKAVSREGMTSDASRFSA